MSRSRPQLILHYHLTGVRWEFVYSDSYIVGILLLLGPRTVLHSSLSINSSYLANSAEHARLTT